MCIFLVNRYIEFIIEIFSHILIEREALQINGEHIICRKVAAEDVDFCKLRGVMSVSVSSDQLEQPVLGNHIADSTKGLLTLKMYF